LAADPVAYLHFLESRLRAQRYDVVLPTHDQAFLLSRFRDRLAALVGLAVPDFEAMERLQSKAAFLEILRELKLPHPVTTMARSRTDVLNLYRFPCYIKLPYSTAGQGVWLIRGSDELPGVVKRLEQGGSGDGSFEVLIQEPAAGRLGVVQSIFQHGRLIAAHCYEARALGVGGSACARVSASHPLVVQQIKNLGAHLNWHGALMLDYLYDPATKLPAYTDANPRIGETMNAMLSGVNLAEALVQIALGRRLDPLPPSRPGVQTHSFVMAVLAAGQRPRPRLGVMSELRHACALGSEDELTRPSEDAWSIVPAALIATQALLRPAWTSQLVLSAVSHYALDGFAAETIRCGVGF
jgi:predicted ATP-grasp superfamily ATP-dependent carboligase